MLRRLEMLIAGALIASRWLMAPLYLGLIAALVIDIVEFFRELSEIVVGFEVIHGNELILAVLKLIDLVLVSNLLLIMLFAGVLTLGANVVEANHPRWAQFMGSVDFAGLKLKVLAALTAIAAVGLLETYVEIASADKSDVLWRVIILLTFVVSGVLLAWMDRLAAGPHHDERQE
jgi:uncharacterized protein (TIGR00645 family)